MNEEEEKINNTIALKVMSIEELKRVKEKVEKTQGDNVRFKVETKHWYGYSEPFLAKDKDVLNISKYTMQLILEEAINKEKERINKLTDKIIELRRASNDK